MPVLILAFAFVLLSFFLGLGISKGANLSKKIAEKDYVYNYKISLNSGKSVDTYVFASYSAYYFYVIKESNNITIVQVENIGSLEMIHKDNIK